MKKRYWEIDALRGLAVLAMVAFHFAFDLNYFAGVNVLPAGLWLWAPRLIGGTFVFLAGVATTLSKRDPIRRGAEIFGWGIIITIITYVAFPQATIWFGVLHLIGAGIILSHYLKKYALPLGAAAIAAGAWLQAQAFSFPWLLWLGLPPQGLYMFDYYPLLPWLGVMLLGVYAGQKIYADKKPVGQRLGWLCALGQNSLLIYLLHQPVLVALVCFLR